MGRAAVYRVHGHGSRDGVSVLDRRTGLDDEIKRIPSERQPESRGADVSPGFVDGVRRARNRNFGAESNDRRRRNQRTFVSPDRIGRRHTCGTFILRRLFDIGATSFLQPAHESQHVNYRRCDILGAVFDAFDGFRRYTFERGRTFGRLQLSRGNIAVVSFDFGDESRRDVNGGRADNFQTSHDNVDGDGDIVSVFKARSLPELPV